MADELKSVEPAKEPKVDEPVEPKQINVDAKMKEIEANLEEKYKTQIAGLDRKVSELSKEKEELALSKMDEKTRAAEEIRLAKEEKQKLMNETEAIKRERLIDKALFDAGLDPKMSSRISGKDESEITEDVKYFNGLINSQVEKRIEEEVNKRLSGKVPIKGKEVTNGSDREKLIQQYNEAEKNGNAIAMMRLKDQIRKLPKQ